MKAALKPACVAQQHKSLLRFLTCGSVDDGKSTLIGRLLHDTRQIYEDQLSSLHNDSKRHGTQGEKLDLALLVDGLQAEREQGITIDVAYRYFSRPRSANLSSPTLPGHEQYTRNMATGASTCDLAILLIDARKGVLRPDPSSQLHLHAAWASNTWWWRSTKWISSSFSEARIQRASAKTI